jgi:Domain of unknown function (DUF1707)
MRPRRTQRVADTRAEFRPPARYAGRMPNPPVSGDDPRRHGQVRASDADRELVVAAVRQAAGDGRLTLEELDQRLEAAYAAKTYADLEELTEDLPLAQLPDPVGGRLPAQRFGGKPTSRFGIAVMSGFGRGGRWVVPRQFTGLVIMGYGAINMRDARFTEQVTRVTAFALMGGIDVIVPEDAEVHARGLGIMGIFSGRRTSGPGQAGTPVIIVTGLAVMGEICVRRRPPRKKNE